MLMSSFESINSGRQYFLVKERIFSCAGISAVKILMNFLRFDSGSPVLSFGFYSDTYDIWPIVYETIVFGM
jgi:hypothetical protein